LEHRAAARRERGAQIELLSASRLPDSSQRPWCGACLWRTGKSL